MEFYAILLYKSEWNLQSWMEVEKIPKTDAVFFQICINFF